MSLSPERWLRVKAVFDAAVALDTTERPAFLTRECGDDAALREQVETLLASYEGAPDFLDTPAGVLLDRPTTPDDLIGRTIGPYRLVERIGAGGMGEVYRAEDSKLNRPVALKLLPERLATDADRLRRFHAEALAASSLNHPQILVVHDFGDVDGRPFIVTEFVEGRTLREQMQAGAIPAPEAVNIAIQVAGALVAAHARGLVHRDIKPENVMLRPDGHVKVLDFGLAKLIPGRGDTAGTSSAHTIAGISLGTPRYMSPEQVRGQDVDERADIWSLGVMLYEMLAGRPPFDGPTPSDVMAAVLRSDPMLSEETLGHVPAIVSAVVEQALAKEAGLRFASASDMHKALVAARVSLDSGAVQAMDSAPMRAVDAPQPPAPDKSIAVLPFVSISTDPENEFFADGVTEEILNALAQIPGLRVAARSSSFSFKGKNEDLRLVGSKLNVATILEGTLRRAGPRLRVTAQLINAVDGYQLWSERYDRDAVDVFAVQDEIAAAIAGRLRLTLAGPLTASLAPPTQDLVAYEMYLKGRALLFQRGSSIPKALACFEQAVGRDANYAQAWAGMADGYTTSGYSGSAPAAEVMPKAIAAARRALDLDPTLAEAHCAFACATLLWDRDYQLAEQEFERSLTLNPNYTQAEAWYALFFLQWICGRTPAAHDRLLHLVENDPLSAYAHVIVAFCETVAGLHVTALRHARRSVELDPDSYLAAWAVMQSLGNAGRFAEAVAAADHALEISGRHCWAVCGLASIYGRWGRQDEARRLFEEAEERSRREHMQPSMLCHAAANAGDIDAGLAYAEQALAEKDPLFVLMARSWPDYGRLRQEPRFNDIVARLQLPQWERL